MYYALAFKFTEMDSSVLCGISPRFVSWEWGGAGAAERGTHWKVSFLFSYYNQTPRTSFTMGSTRRRSLQKHFNYGLLACVQEGAGHRRLGGQSKASNRPDSEKGMEGGGGTQCNYYHQEQLQQHWNWALVVHKQAIPFVQTFVLTPSYRSSRGKKQGITFSFLIINI